MAEAEDFPPTVPDYEPVAEAAPQPEPAETAPAASVPALHGHDRVMMALSLGQVARAAVREPSGALLVEAGQTVTAEVTQAAARAGADTLYALWKATQEPEAEA